MVSCQEVLAFIIAIALGTNVVPSAASRRREQSPYDSEAATPYGSETPSPNGSVLPSPYGSEPPSPRGSALPSPYGSMTHSPYSSAPPSPSGTVSVPVRVPNEEKGEHNFGEFVPGEYLLGVPGHIHQTQPDPSLASYGGVHSLDVHIRSPNGERISRCEVDSALGIYSEGEQVQFLGFIQNHEAVHLRIWSKRYTDINYVVRLYGY